MGGWVDEMNLGGWVGGWVGGKVYLRRALNRSCFHDSNQSLILNRRVLWCLGHPTKEGEAGSPLAAGGTSGVPFQPGVNAVGLLIGKGGWVGGWEDRGGRGGWNEEGWVGGRRRTWKWWRSSHPNRLVRSAPSSMGSRQITQGSRLWEEGAWGKAVVGVGGWVGGGVSEGGKKSTKTLAAGARLERHRG